VVLLAAHAAPANRLGRLFLPVTTRLKTDSAVALTFDDGPDHGLDMFLDLLERAKARVTFFVVGEQAERAPSKLQEIVSCGHEVGVHGYRHRSYLFLTPSQAMEDMRRAKGVIEASWLEAGRQGWERVLWSREARDWDAQATPQSIVDSVGWLEAGDIILLHDTDRYFSNAAPGSQRNTLRALPIILERVSTLSLQACSVGELLDTEEVNAGKQPT
jgi:peptidoglycan/xylan/chitin deacetylase (PgdA/CDA1 family)